MKSPWRNAEVPYATTEKTSALSRWKAASFQRQDEKRRLQKESEAAAAAAWWKADCFRSRPLKRNRYVWCESSVGRLHSVFVVPEATGDGSFLSLLLFYSLLVTQMLMDWLPSFFPAAAARHAATCFYSRVANMWCMMCSGRDDEGKITTRWP